MSGDSDFVGWVAHDKSSVEGKLKLESYKVKGFEETDVEGDIICCGCCASDIHVLRSGWGKMVYPTVVGHEIALKVTKVGSQVRDISVGDRVGVGAQSGSCLDCEFCKNNQENYCKAGQIGTYQGKWNDGSMSMGGYAKRWRGPGHFCVKIPDGLASEVAAPLMCGGITAYSPLKDAGVGTPTGKRVGIIGVGGIGAFGIAFAKALGAETIVAISTTASKKDLAFELGATDMFPFKQDESGFKKWHKGLDVILNTSSVSDLPYSKFIPLLRPRGILYNIAVPESPVEPIPIGPLLFNGALIGGSAIGSPAQIHEMLELAVKTNLKTMIEKRKFEDANEMVKDMVDGKPRFRYVLMVQE